MHTSNHRALCTCVSPDKQVAFQLELDLYEFCSPELKKALEGPRAAFKEAQDRAIEAAKKAKNEAKKAAAAGGAAPMAVEPAAPAAAEVAVAGAGVDVEMKDADGAAGASTSGAGAESYVGAATGAGSGAARCDVLQHFCSSMTEPLVQNFKGGLKRMLCDGLLACLYPMPCGAHTWFATWQSTLHDSGFPCHGCACMQASTSCLAC